MSPGFPQTSGQPIVDEIMQKHAELSPPAQQAVGLSRIPAMAETRLAPTLPPSPEMPPPTSQTIPTAAQTVLPLPSKVRGFGPLPGSPEAAHAAELEHLKSSPSGIGQIHNPWARHGLQIADAIGSAFLPSLTMSLPGTELHHQLLLSRAEGNVRNDQQTQAAQDTSRLHQAQATEQESLPELHQTQAQLAAEKLKSSNAQKEADRVSREAIAGDRNDTSVANTKSRTEASLRKSGLRTNAEGEIEAIPYEELSERDQITNDLRDAQGKAAAARAALIDAQAKNEPEKMKLAQQRVDHANRASDIAIRRLQLSEQQTEARLHGTQGGEALPGAMLNDQGKPVGTAFQGNVRPTGSERNKGDMAQSAHEQLGTLKEIVARRPDIFGPIAGRKTDFQTWLGSQDPDAQRFAAARTIAADHLAGTFGGRSEAALHALDNAIGQFKTNPAAVQAGLDQLEKGNEVFRKAGTMRTAGSAAGNAATGGPPTVNSQAEYDKLPSGTIYLEDGKKYRKP